LSEATEGVQEGQEGSSITRTGIAVMSVIAILAVALGLMTVGFIPTVRGGHGGTVTVSGRGQFITVTSTVPPVTSTITSPGGVTTVTSNGTVGVISTVTHVVAGDNVTTTQTVTNVSTSTTTVQTIILQPTTTTSTLTQTTTSTTTVAPTDPLTVNVTMDPPANPADLYAGEFFTIGVSVNNMLSYTNLTIVAYQVSFGSTPQVISFYPQVPESVEPVVGNSFYTIEGNISQSAPVGDYQIVVQVQASSPGVTVNSVSQQYLLNLAEPLSFNGYSFVNSTSNFSGNCTASTIEYSGNTNWYWECPITAAPSTIGNMTFTVSNAANVPICVSTSIQSTTMTGFVNMNPYPFCPNGAPGVYVPANATNWPITYTVENGATAGLQTVYFLFQRALSS
jgi:hypothetical protein